MSVSDEKTAECIIPLSPEERLKENKDNTPDNDNVFEVNGVTITNGVTTTMNGGGFKKFGDGVNGGMGVNGLRDVADRRVVVMKCSRQVKEIHTIMWDR